MAGSSLADPLPSKDRRVDIALRGEVKQQCWRAEIAGLRLDYLLERQGLEYDVDVPRSIESAVVQFNLEIWSNAQTVLSAAGVVSRILFPAPPPKGETKDEKERLRFGRLTAAWLRADSIWKTWPLPPKKALRPLRRREVRYAAEHVENGAPEWFASQETFPLFAFGMGRTPPKGAKSEIRTAYRYLFQDSRRIKVGVESCDLRALLACLAAIRDALPTTGGIQVALPFWPVRRQPNGEVRRLNSCPLSTRPPSRP